MNILPSMLAIRAIDTSYNGYWFRSRLEARWAVFLDSAKIEYKYEYQGYKSGKYRYLPDFRLPTFQGLEQYWEVKPKWPTEEEIEKAIMLCIGLQRPVCFLVGDVWMGQYEVIRYMPLNATFLSGYGTEPLMDDDYIHWRGSDQAIVFRPLASGKTFISDIADLKRGFACALTRFVQCKECGEFRFYQGKCARCGFWSFHLDSPALQSAFTAARSARFEHGERG